MTAGSGGWLIAVWSVLLARLAGANERATSVYVYDAENVESLGLRPEEAVAYRALFAGPGLPSVFSGDADFDYPDYWIAKNLRAAFAEHRDFELVSDPKEARIVVVALWGYGFCTTNSESKLDLWEVSKRVFAFDQQCPPYERVLASLAETERFRVRPSGTTHTTDHFFLAEYSGMDLFFAREYPSVMEGWLRPPNRSAFKDGATVITVEEAGYRLEQPSIVVPYNVQRMKWFLPWEKEHLQSKTSLIGFVGTVEGVANLDVCPRCRNGLSNKAVRRSLVTNVRRACQEAGRTCTIIALDDVLGDAYSERDDHAAIARKVKMDAIAKESVFCLVPRGDTASSRRLFCAIQALCIPVVVSDHFELPFASQLPWDDMILRVPENAVVTGNASDVYDFLAQLPPENIRQRQRALHTHRRSLLWHDAGHNNVTAGAMAHLLFELQRSAPPLDD